MDQDRAWRTAKERKNLYIPVGGEFDLRSLVSRTEDMLCRRVRVVVVVMVDVVLVGKKQEVEIEGCARRDRGTFWRPRRRKEASQL